MEKSCQRSNFSSKAVGKIIAEVEAKKTLFASAVPRQFFCRRNRTNLCICLGPRQSSEVTTVMLFYLINHYKAIINCSAKPVSNLKTFASGDWLPKQMSLE